MKKILLISLSVLLSYGCAPPPTQQHGSQGGLNPVTGTPVYPPGTSPTLPVTMPPPPSTAGGSQRQGSNTNNLVACQQAKQFFDSTILCINQAQTFEVVKGCLTAATHFLPQINSFIPNQQNASQIQRDMLGQTNQCVERYNGAQFKGCLAGVWQNWKTAFIRESNC